MVTYIALCKEAWNLWQECRLLIENESAAAKSGLRDLRNVFNEFEAIREKPKGWHVSAELIFQSIAELLEQLAWEDDRKWLGVRNEVDHLNAVVSLQLFGRKLEPDCYYEEAAVSELITLKLKQSSSATKQNGRWFVKGATIGTAIPELQEVSTRSKFFAKHAGSIETIGGGRGKALWVDYLGLRNLCLQDYRLELPIDPPPSMERQEY